MPDLTDNDFAERLIHWYDQFGRKSLPWQSNRDPYRVWVSEIMLQQTQVTAVIPYYERFMARFPRVTDLAEASADDVMVHWSGLGYYARARNLHRAARQVVEQHDGKFPSEIDHVVALPGIGLSTAGAILAFCFNQRHPILDGNVKRVLTRYFAIDGYPGQAAISRRLWELADDLTPVERVADYTQAIMDLGATLCTRTRPGCSACPQSGSCRAFAQGEPTAFPTRKPKKQRPERDTAMLLFVDDTGQVLLERRPPSGIWGGLWSLPEAVAETPMQKARDLGLEPNGDFSRLPALQHGFTHFLLNIDPIVVPVTTSTAAINESADIAWIKPENSDSLGLPKPVTTLLANLAQLSDSPTNVIT